MNFWTPFSLDLYEFDLYGAESPKSLEIVEEYMKLIREGAKCPPVYVARITDKKYVLSYYFEDNEIHIRDIVLE